MPQPLSRVRANAREVGFTEFIWPRMSPKVMALASQVIAEWALLDSYMSGIFVKMLGANPEPAAAIYGALTATATQKAAWRAVAKVTLSAEDNDYLAAILHHSN